jgi:molybdopterin-guanine dinucleotide biosynthesis protein A
MDAFILAGGKSRRMGRNKALMEIGGVPIVQRALDALAQVAERVRVIADEPEDYRFLGVPILRDAIGGMGPIGGVYTAARASGSGLFYTVACDLPALQPDLMRLLAEEAKGYDAAVPRTGERAHPLCAVYARSCEAVAKAQIRTGRLKMMEFLHQIRTRWVDPETWRQVDPEGRSFWNVNRPETYREVKARVERGGPPPDVPR